ncbi:MAG: hypothetical protein QOG28_6385 [Trebonia sp.]|nr:hypothetical protein [Trebonia sp.]
MRFFSIGDDVSGGANYARFGCALSRGRDVGVATRVGPKLQSVLGLSITSTGVGWVLLDGQGPDAVTLDHDAFDVQCDAEAGDKPQHSAAARGAQAIATASGHKVGSVRVTWSEDVEPDATALLKSLADSGSENVHPIPLSQAARSWAVEAGRASEHAKTALCILEPGTATVMVVATGAGSVRTAVTNTREHTADLVDWLTTIFNKDGWLPECLHLVGSQDELDAVTGPIDDALPIPVFASVDSQLALARGAALATVWPGAAVSSRSSRQDTPRPDRSRRLREAKKVAVPAAPTVASPVALAAAPTVASPVALAAAPTDASPVADAPRSDTPRPDRSRLPRDVKKVAVSAAAVAAVGAALSLAAGSALNGGGVYMEAASSPAAAAPMTSTSVHAVPAPVSAPPAAQVPAMVAEAPPAQPAPQETLAPPAEHLAAVTPEHVDAPVHQQTVPASPFANVSAAAPTAAPLAVPAAVPSAPIVSPAPIVAPAAPLAVPAAVPSAPIVAPAPIVAAAPAPLTVPAMGQPAPIAAPPAAPLAVPPTPIAVPPGAPPDPPVPPPPPDPLQIVLSPLFSGLP